MVSSTQRLSRDDRLPTPTAAAAPARAEPGGFSMADHNDPNAVNAEGYTELEVYLNSLVIP